MSAPFCMRADQLRRFARFLDDVSAATTAHQVRAGAYGSIDVDVDGTAVSVRWDADLEQYVTDDRVGS